MADGLEIILGDRSQERVRQRLRGHHLLRRCRAASCRQWGCSLSVATRWTSPSCAASMATTPRGSQDPRRGRTRCDRTLDTMDEAAARRPSWLRAREDEQTWRFSSTPKPHPGSGDHRPEGGKHTGDGGRWIQHRGRRHPRSGGQTVDADGTSIPVFNSVSDAASRPPTPTCSVVSCRRSSPRGAVMEASTRRCHWRSSSPRGSRCTTPRTFFTYAQNAGTTRVIPGPTSPV